MGLCVAKCGAPRTIQRAAQSRPSARRSNSTSGKNVSRNDRNGRSTLPLRFASREGADPHRPGRGSPLVMIESSVGSTARPDTHRRRSVCRDAGVWALGHHRRLGRTSLACRSAAAATNGLADEASINTLSSTTIAFGNEVQTVCQFALGSPCS